MVRKVLLVLLLAGLAVASGASVASAHALVRTSDPTDGAILQKAPSQVVITFTEPPDPGLSFIHVLNQAGQDVEKGTTQRVPGQPLVLKVAVGSLPDGVYTVTWRAVSRVDGHVTAGSFSFGIGVAPSGAPSGRSTSIPRTPSPSALAVAGRWAFYWGLALLVGGAAFGLVVVDGLPPRGRALLIASWVVSAIGLILMTMAERSTVGVPLGALLRSGAGHRYLDRGVALLVTGGAVAAAVLLRRRIWLAATGLAAAGTMLVHALAGHAGAEGGNQLRWFDVAMQEAHLVAVGIWIGGLAWLLLFLLGPQREGTGQTVKRFSWLAGLALAAVAITGAVRAANQLGGVHFLHGLLHTSFGVALLVKLGLFGALVALGARNRYVHVPAVSTEGQRPRPLRRAVGAELLLAAGILGATAVLSELPPASVVAAAERPVVAPRVVAVGSDFATTVKVRLVVSPGLVGPNLFQAEVSDFDTGRLAPASQVSLTFSLRGRPELGTPTLALSRGPSGLWTGRGTILSMTGRWDVSVLVAEPAGAVTVPLSFQTRLPPERIQVLPGGPGQPTIYTISLQGGRTLQTYVDPAKPGNDVVHFTFFVASGAEQPIARATATATDPSGRTTDMPLIRFDAGHFAANTRLAAGRWRFQITATAPNGDVFDAYFTQTIS